MKKEKPDNAKVEIRLAEEHGVGVFAVEDIVKDEHIGGFYGQRYINKKLEELSGDARIYALQYSEFDWRDGEEGGVARYINHSCDPNCGISGLFDVVAMRDIKAGEELTWHYGMTDKNNMTEPKDCRCGSVKCMGEFYPGYSQISNKKKKEWEGYFSNWLVE